MGTRDTNIYVFMDKDHITEFLDGWYKALNCVVPNNLVISDVENQFDFVLAVRRAIDENENIFKLCFTTHG